LITITRRFASQLRSVLRRAFGSFRSKSHVIGFIAEREGLTVKSAFGDVAVEFRMPGEFTPETIWLPFEFLAEIEGKKDEPVELEATGDDQVTVRRYIRDEPQVLSYRSKEPLGADKFPLPPATFTSNPPGLLQALHEASQVTDPDSLKYATCCIQLTPDGTINATDGRQALIQSGFSFPWKEPVLVPPNKIFASPDLPQDQPVQIGQSGDWVALRIGCWTMYLKTNPGKYPQLSQVVPKPDAAVARCQLSKDDVRFLSETLPQLPGDDMDSRPVTIDVNGHIAIRGKAGDQAKPTEAVLTNSRAAGEPVRISTNRQYLATAMRLGLQDLCLYSDSTAMLCQGDSCKYVWMPLNTESAILPAEDAIRIESPKGEPAAPVPPSINTEPETAMSEPTTTTTEKPTSQTTTAAKAPRRKASQQDITTLIEQAVQFRSALHGLIQEANGLVKALKQHRRKSKAIQNTLESLKQLKSLGV
jgi:hypothetical protein